MRTIFIIVFTATLLQACAQKRERQLGGCENCDLIFEGMPKMLDSHARIASKDEPGEALYIKGNVFHVDGKTPAADIILYFYHTDNSGVYSKGSEQFEKTVHGRLRGWIKTARDGSYSITTIRPGAYPDSKEPQHIHVIIKEKQLAPYWIDDVTFSDDPFVTATYQSRQQNRGGSGTVTLTKDAQGIWQGRRDIILGKNVPGY